MVKNNESPIPKPEGQGSESGHDRIADLQRQLDELEKVCCSKGTNKIEIPNAYKEWQNKPKIINWLSSDPYLSKVDLRDYFWISRDKLSSMQSNLLVSPIIKSLMVKLEPVNMPEKLSKKILND